MISSGPPRCGQRLHVAGVGDVGRCHGDRSAVVGRTHLGDTREERPVARDLCIEDLVQVGREVPELLLVPRLRRSHREAACVPLQIEDVLLEEEPELVDRERSGGEFRDEGVFVQPLPDPVALRAEVIRCRSGRCDLYGGLFHDRATIPKARCTSPGFRELGPNSGTRFQHMELTGKNPRRTPADPRGRHVRGSAYCENGHRRGRR